MKSLLEYQVLSTNGNPHKLRLAIEKVNESGIFSRRDLEKISQADAEWLEAEQVSVSQDHPHYELLKNYNEIVIQEYELIDEDVTLSEQFKKDFSNNMSSMSSSEKKNVSMVGLPSLFVSAIVFPALVIYEYGFSWSLVQSFIIGIPFLFFFSAAILSFFNLSPEERRDLKIASQVEQEAKDQEQEAKDQESREFYRNRLAND
jgi:hypothetical protein